MPKYRVVQYIFYIFWIFFNKFIYIKYFRNDIPLYKYKLDIKIKLLNVYEYKFIMFLII